MKNLRLILLWLIFGLVSQSAIAGSNSYQCVISEQLFLEGNGTLKRPPKPYLIGQRFAVDRNNGHIVGPELGLWQLADQKITVLARGNKNNSFTVASVGPAGSNGVNATLLEVEGFAEGESKPFVVLSGLEVTSGTCK